MKVYSLLYRPSTLFKSCGKQFVMGGDMVWGLESLYMFIQWKKDTPNKLVVVVLVQNLAG
jgi:hypothetical protein